MSELRVRTRRAALFAFAALLALAGAALGDVVHLKDGSRVSGEVLSQNTRLVRVRTAAGKIETFRKSDVEKVEIGVDLDPETAQAERDAPFMPGLSLEQRKFVRAEARRFGAKMGIELQVAARRRVYVFGDQPQAVLTRVAAAVEMTVHDFVDVMECDLHEALPGRKYEEAGQFYVFQFKQEPAYQRFLDRVFDPMRDETVSDERLKLIRRQPGFWIITPRPLMGRYQGAAPIETVIANASHLASHALLQMYEWVGGWWPWWFLEGVATWQEIRLHGHALTYCIEVARPGDYVRPGTPDADEAAKARIANAWRKKVKARVRSRDVQDLSVLGKRSLNELVLDDVMQAWSITEWLARRNKLIPFTLAYKEERDLSAACETVLKKPAQGVHEEWRAWVLKTY